MALRYGRLRQISRFLPHLSSGNHCQQSRHFINNLSSSLLQKSHQCRQIKREVVFSFSTISPVSHDEPLPLVDLLPFLESTINELQGPHHCWFNIAEENREFFRRDGAFLVLAGKFRADTTSELAGSDPVTTFEKVKYIQQRFPLLQVMVLMPDSSINSAIDKSHLVELVMKEYITFPILLSNKNFHEMEKGACYILFKDFKNPFVYHDEGTDLQMLNKAVEELNAQHSLKPDSSNNLRSSWVKQTEAHKEPYVCSSLRNLFLHFPGCISMDESGNRLFLSDSNHHRIIISDSNGKIVDCIGSCPGFEDGEFESAKLVRPAASIYDEDEDCLYIIDSENHAIRRADLEKRVLETLYPPCSINKRNNGLWTWIANKLGFGRNNDTKTEDFDPQSLMFPWHMMKSVDDSLLIINRSFETLWILDSASGQIKEVVRGSSKILEICGQMIMEKAHLLKQIPQNLLRHQIDPSCSLKGLPHAGVISSFVAFQNHIIMCDLAGQRIMKASVESGLCSNFHFSNFGILGLPYWLAFPLERVYAVADGLQGAFTDHVQHFSLLPGRIDIQIAVDIPSNTDLVELLQEGCIWRQARGAAAEVSGADSVVESSEKVGAAQQWYDDLDNLAFSTPESEFVVDVDDASSELRSNNNRVQIDCAVNTSPGTSEVIVDAALYLRLKQDPEEQEEGPEKYAERIVDIMNPDNSRCMERDACIRFLQMSNRDLRDLVFVKPLRVRIRFECPDHPKADNTKSIILTESKIEVNVSLRK